MTNKLSLERSYDNERKDESWDQKGSHQELPVTVTLDDDAPARHLFRSSSPSISV